MEPNLRRIHANHKRPAVFAAPAVLLQLALAPEENRQVVLVDPEPGQKEKMFRQCVDHAEALGSPLFELMPRCDLPYKMLTRKLHGHGCAEPCENRLVLCQRLSVVIEVDRSRYEYHTCTLHA